MSERRHSRDSWGALVAASVAALSGAALGVEPTGGVAAVVVRVDGGPVAGIPVELFEVPDRVASPPCPCEPLAPPLPAGWSNPVQLLDSNCQCDQSSDSLSAWLSQTPAPSAKATTGSCGEALLGGLAMGHRYLAVSQTPQGPFAELGGVTACDEAARKELLDAGARECPREPEFPDACVTFSALPVVRVVPLEGERGEPLTPAGVYQTFGSPDVLALPLSFDPSRPTVPPDHRLLIVRRSGSTRVLDWKQLGQEDPEVRLCNLATVSGEVTLGGRPVRGAWIHFDLGSVQANAEGRFETQLCRLNPRQSGPDQYRHYTAIVRLGAERAQASFNFTASATVHLALALEQPASLRARVVDATSGEPLGALATLTLRGKPSATSSESITESWDTGSPDDGGWWSARDLAPIPYELEAYDPHRYQAEHVGPDGDFCSVVQGVTLKAAEAKQVEIPVVRGLHLLGSIQDEMGRPLEGARVTAWPNSRVNTTALATATADSQGQFVIRRLAPGHIVITVDDPIGHGSPIQDYAVEVPHGPLTFIVPGGSVVLTVVDHRGTPIPGVHVHVRVGKRGWGFSADAKGRATFRTLPAGDIELNAEDLRTGQSTTVVIRLAKGESRQIVLKLPE